MRKNTLIIVALIIAIILGVYIYFRLMPRDKEAEPITTEPRGNVEAALVGQGESGATGRVNFARVQGKAQINIEVAGLSIQDFHPASIKKGSCANPGETLYELSAISQGKSQSNLPVSIEDLYNNRPLAVTVYKSLAEANSLVACGEIKF